MPVCGTGFCSGRHYHAGLYGWGEDTLEWKTRAVVGAVEDLAPLLIGADPRDIERNIRIMHKRGFWKLGVIGTTAISGIEMALWDILGKYAGLPVWRLLGGKVRERIPVYTHLGMGKSDAYSSSRPRGMAATIFPLRDDEEITMVLGLQCMGLE